MTEVPSSTTTAGPAGLDRRHGDAHGRKPRRNRWRRGLQVGSPLKRHIRHGSRGIRRHVLQQRDPGCRHTPGDVAIREEPAGRQKEIHILEE